MMPLIAVVSSADQETFKKVLSEVDIAISTAAIPGRWDAGRMKGSVMVHG